MSVSFWQAVPQVHSLPLKTAFYAEIGLFALRPVLPACTVGSFEFMKMKSLLWTKVCLSFTKYYNFHEQEMFQFLKVILQIFLLIQLFSFFFSKQNIYSAKLYRVFEYLFLLTILVIIMHQISLRMT